MKKEKRPVGKGAWLKVFCPEARCLTEEEILSIPPEERKGAESGAEKGLWLEVFCPEGACLKEEERIDLQVAPAQTLDFLDIVQTGTRREAVGLSTRRV